MILPAPRAMRRAATFLFRRPSFKSVLLLPLLGALFTQPSIAQDWPKQTIKIVSPYTAGGLGDTLPRIVAAGLSERLGQQVIVENVPGASQLVGVQAVARAKPDGYTLLFASSTSMGINVAVSKALPYDPVRDFAPIAIAFSTPLYLAVTPKLPVNSVQELIALAKREPGKLNFASGGLATSNHLAGELFKALAGVDMVHVPYKGTGPAMIDLVAGHVDLMFAGEGAEQAKQGNLRALAVTDRVRSRSAPDIPTMQEAGVKDYEMAIWFGFVAPAGTPEPIVEKLSAEIRKVLESPMTRDRSNGADITPSTPAEMKARIPKDIEMWTAVTRQAKIQLQ
ncbi:MAG: tripartite tricarboxylate transporter substrate binding protein [Hyphomicrobiales bacterium]|nr:tripartite tricarboxylate transporter substrate binding protein [Hyphomicrobiales bacterium]